MSVLGRLQQLQRALLCVRMNGKQYAQSGGWLCTLHAARSTRRSHPALLVRYTSRAAWLRAPNLVIPAESLLTGANLWRSSSSALDPSLIIKAPRLVPRPDVSSDNEAWLGIAAAVLCSAPTSGWEIQPRVDSTATLPPLSTCFCRNKLIVRIWAHLFGVRTISAGHIVMKDRLNSKYYG